MTEILRTPEQRAQILEDLRVSSDEHRFDRGELNSLEAGFPPSDVPEHLLIAPLPVRRAKAAAIPAQQATTSRVASKSYPQRHPDDSDWRCR